MVRFSSNEVTTRGLREAEGYDAVVPRALERFRQPWTGQGEVVT